MTRARHVPRGPINRFEQSARRYWEPLHDRAPAEIERLIAALDALTQCLRDLERLGVHVEIPRMGVGLGDARGAD